MGISISLKKYPFGETERLNGFTLFTSITLFFLSSHTATKGKKTKRECIGVLVDSLNSNKRMFAFSREENINPIALPKKPTFLALRLLFLPRYLKETSSMLLHKSIFF